VLRAAPAEEVPKRERNPMSELPNVFVLVVYLLAVGAAALAVTVAVWR
jgi:hypothetical protein